MTAKKEDNKVSFETVYDVLHYVQKNLHAPKNQYNKFGNYNFRNCEDIQEGLKKVLPEGAASYVTDEIVIVGNRIYVKATAHLCFKDQCVTNSAFAREPDEQKGMSVSQVTGAASSYARKYALGGLYMVDDQKDADSQDKVEEKNTKQPVKQESKPTPEAEMYKRIKKQLDDAGSPETLKYVYDGFKADIEKLPKAGQDKLNEIYGKRMEAVSQAPLDEDQIPY